MWLIYFELILNIDAPIPHVLSVKYWNFTVTLFLRGHHVYLELKPVIGDDSSLCEKENRKEYDENTGILYTTI